MTKPITHRCPGSLAAKASIRYEKKFYDTPPKWYLKIYGINFDWDCVELQSTTEIKYCQFCGEKLKEPTKEVESVWDDVAELGRRVYQRLAATSTPEEILEMKKNLHSPSECFIWSDKEKQEFKKRIEDQCLDLKDQQAASHTKTSQKN